MTHAWGSGLVAVALSVLPPSLSSRSQISPLLSLLRVPVIGSGSPSFLRSLTSLHLQKPFFPNKEGHIPWV